MAKGWKEKCTSLGRWFHRNIYYSTIKKCRPLVKKCAIGDGHSVPSPIKRILFYGFDGTVWALLSLVI